MPGLFFNASVIHKSQLTETDFLGLPFPRHGPMPCGGPDVPEIGQPLLDLANLARTPTPSSTRDSFKMVGVLLSGGTLLMSVGVGDPRSVFETQAEMQT